MPQMNKIGGNVVIPIDEHFGFGVPDTADASTGPRVLAVDGDPNGLPVPVGSMALDFTTPAIWQATNAIGAWAIVGGAAPVISVFGRVGAVVANGGDYAASQVTNDSTAPGATVADALSGLTAYSNKNPTRLATTADHALNGLAAVDGVVPLAGDRVFVWQQAVASENGIYLAAAGAWVRANDFNDATADGIQAGVNAYVQEGTNNSRTWITLVTTGVIVVGATALTFIQGGPIVRSDLTEFTIIPGGVPAALAATEIAAGAQMDVVDIRDYRMVTVFVDVLVIGAITTLSVQGRTSGKAAPVSTVDADWAAIKSDDLTKTTGVSLVQNYTLQLPVGAIGRYGPFRFPADSGSSFSARVWVDDGTGSSANVFAYRSV